MEPDSDEADKDNSDESQFFAETPGVQEHEDLQTIAPPEIQESFENLDTENPESTQLEDTELYNPTSETFDNIDSHPPESQTLDDIQVDSPDTQAPFDTLDLEPPTTQNTFDSIDVHPPEIQDSFDNIELHNSEDEELPELEAAPQNTLPELFDNIDLAPPDTRDSFESVTYEQEKYPRQFPSAGFRTANTHWMN